MRTTIIRLALLIAIAAASVAPAAAADPCATGGQSLGVSRIVEIDTSTGALFGGISTQVREARFLEPKEVILTFDDGPMPAITKPILDTLDRFCTKATFFSVGRMALAYPATIKSILARGHTLGSHTYSHPLNLKRLSMDKAKDEIEKGHAAITLAAGRPIAPFFRFPGLSDSGPMLKHLQGRGIASFTVDVVSNDSYISDGERLLQRTLREVEQNKGGIVLFHDIKPATARILPRFLAELHARGYRVVHMRPKASVAPLAEHLAKLAPLLAKEARAGDPPALVPFYDAMKVAGRAEDDASAVSEIAPAARPRGEVHAAPARQAAVAPRPTAGRKPTSEVRGWQARVKPASGPVVFIEP